MLEKNPSDVDIVHYFSVAEKAMEEQFFFLDEVPESSDLEDRQNLAFSYTNLKKGKSIFYADGLASVYGTGGRIQYIRNLHIYDFDSQGNCVQSLRVPYAKIMAQPIETLSEKQQSDLLAAGVNKKSDVPLVMLKAVDRSNRGVISEPEWSRNTGDTPDTILMLPIACGIPTVNIISSLHYCPIKACGDEISYSFFNENNKLNSCEQFQVKNYLTSQVYQTVSFLYKREKGSPDQKYKFIEYIDTNTISFCENEKIYNKSSGKITYKQYPNYENVF